MRQRMTALLLALVFLLAAGSAFAESAAPAPVYSRETLFTDRDLLQEADPAGAEMITVQSGEDVRITSEGVYFLTGEAAGTTVYVEARSDAKVQLVLRDLSITNEDFPCIYVLSADKVFITVAGDSTLSVTGDFRTDGSTKTDGAVFSLEDTVLSGTAVLTVSSAVNGIVCKDDLKITGGTYHVRAGKKAVEANDSIRIAGGTFDLEAGTDGLHAENKEDSTLGFIYICGGTIRISAGDDGIQATSVLQIDGGAFDIASAEGMAAARIIWGGGDAR